VRVRQQTFPSREALANGIANRIEEALRQGIAHRGGACAVLSGGSTPGPGYKLLGQRKLDWNKVTFALADERCVPVGDPASNETLLRETLAPALAQGAKIAPMLLDGADPQSAARNANAVYAGLPLDIVLLGMGDDGHTLSWFPQSVELPAVLDINNPATVMAIHAPGAAGSADRLTLTRAALSRAQELVVALTGAAKLGVSMNAIAGRSGLPAEALFKPPMPPVDVLWAA
jgi:6-phosphogluconolactonase